MMDSFKRFLNLPEQEKKDVFAGVAERLNILPSYVEKDFWVCLILNLLYNELPEGHPKMFFKGGTSLSKAFGLIKRFSEDIDLVISRDDLGFRRDRDPTIPSDLSAKKQKSLLEELRIACSDYILKVLKVDVEKLIKDLVTGCLVYPDEQDRGKQTLLIEYPTLYSDGGIDYARPQVKIEGGARSGLEPNQTCTIKPDIANELADWPFSVENILTIAPERTYWEKLLILHGEYHGYQDGGNGLPGRNRLSRHYYDVAMITAKKIGRAALLDHALLDSVREHNRIAFPQKKKKWEEAVPGKLKLIPQPELREMLKEDYAAMEGMIIGEPPEFEWIMEQIEFAEAEINRS